MRSKKGEGMGVIGGIFFTLGAVLGVWGYSTGNKTMMYVGIGMCVLGAVAYKFVGV
ncbi:hypothetical protein KY362_04985 [Candidatus Woesearchaeota archaeon]|nr:hypothetical protein [Candidatus Woesearchaeota archaeon]